MTLDKSFATIKDVIDLWRELTPEEITRAKALLPVISDTLRLEAENRNKNIDLMIADNPIYATVVKSVTVDIVARTLLTSTSDEPMTQESQSALGYSWSGTFLVPGGGLFIKNSELKRLGLKKQRMGAINLYGEEVKRNTDYFS